MAKKKQAAAGSNGGAATRPRAKKSTAASDSASSKSGNNKAPARAKQQHGPSTPLIGEAAGKVWQALSDDGPQSVGALKKAVGVSDEVVLLAIGWLAREDKLEFETTGRTTTVSLR